MNTMNNDPRVDRYIESLPTWQQHICRNVRKLIHSADPEIFETIKRQDRPYFVLNGNICAFLGTKDHVNIFIYDPIVPDPAHIINQGHGNLTARSIQIYKNDILNEKAFINLIKAVVKNNRACGWRKLQKSGSTNQIAV
jgi:hypothetical protein